eukprot:1180696-Prorocentrum_minimum.AAC.2
MTVRGSHLAPDGMHGGKHGPPVLQYRVHPQAQRRAHRAAPGHVLGPEPLQLLVISKLPQHLLANAFAVELLQAGEERLGKRKFITISMRSVQF